MPWIIHTTNESNMPTFNDSNNIPPVLPEGDYIFCVTGFECRISQGQKTRGCDQYEIELEIEPSGKKVTDILTDHPSCAWKIDTFIKSAGIRMAKGMAFEFRADLAKRNNVPFVNPMGLRGWCRLIQDQLPPREGKNEKPLTVNKVAAYYTDKPKLIGRSDPEEDKAF